MVFPMLSFPHFLMKTTDFGSSTCKTYEVTKPFKGRHIHVHIHAYTHVHTQTLLALYMVYAGGRAPRGDVGHVYVMTAAKANTYT